MSPPSGARPRAALQHWMVVGGALALLLPWLVMAGEAPSMVVLTALAVAALAGLHARTAVRAAAVHAPRRPSTESGSVVLRAGRPTDTPHHPLRPRAPGSV